MPELLPGTETNILEQRHNDDNPSNSSRMSVGSQRSHRIINTGNKQMDRCRKEGEPTLSMWKLMG